MDRRAKILAGALGAMVLLGMGDRVVYPRWIKPLLTIDDRVAERQLRLDSLQADQDAVERAAMEYEALVSRVGTFDVTQAKNVIRARISTLIDKHKLESANITPVRPKTDSKTGLTRMAMTVKAVGTLQSCMEFLKDVAELPQVSRIGNAAFNPISQKRRSRGKPRLNIRVPIEVLVLSQQKVVGHIDPTTLEQPKSFPRHLDRNYSLIWDLEPFSVYVPPKPLLAKAGRDVSQRPSKKKVTIGARASGGDGDYTYQWNPCDRLQDCHVATPQVDCSEEFEQIYKVTVTDGDGKAASDTMKLAIKIPSPPLAPPPGPRTTKRGPVRWKDNKHMQVRMALLCSSKAGNTDELAVFNKRAKKMDYYAIGDEFDGGELVFVHPTGAVVRRNEQYFICPIGNVLSNDLLAADVDEMFGYEYPQLVAAVDWFHANDEAEAEAQADAEAALKAEQADAADGAKDKAKKTSDPETAGKAEGDKTKPPAKAVKKPARSRDARRKPGLRRPARTYPPLPEDIRRRLLKENQDRVNQKPNGESPDDDPAKEEADAEEKEPE